MHRFRSFIGVLLVLSMLPIAAPAGTTGGIAGRVVDATSQAPIANVAVTATSPSQVATTTTDATGAYRFLSLAPDAYTVSFARDTYDPQSVAGVAVFADQVQTANAALNKALKTIAQVQSRAAGNLLKPGTTSDLYSVNAATAQAAAGLVGPGGLSNAYGAIASVPGVSVDAGQQGWFQQVHIRGGDIDQVGYELDGIPVNRVYDNAPQTMLSSLGQQELQVYTGGTPASAEAQGIAGYVNQVVKTGTYPGFGTTNFTIGGPAFYHRASIEAGGSNQARTFSYYVGIAGANQDYRYVNNNNGNSDLNWFFYPVNAYAGSSGVYVGGVPAAGQPPLFANGNLYGIASTYQRDNIANLHFAIPHKHSNLRDDVQLLYLTSEILTSYYSSSADLGAPLVSGINAFNGYPSGPAPVWNDGAVYTGPMFTPVQQNKAVTYYFPSSASHQLGATVPLNERDINDNGVAVTKIQYQHAFSDRAFMRLYGYTLYSNWFIYGPNSANQAYGAELADYEIPDHTYGANLSFTDQLNSQNLVALGVSFTNATLQRYSNGFVRGNPNVATLLNPSTQVCYDPTGATTTPVSCYSAQIGAATIQGGVPVVPAGLPAGTNFIATSGGIIANLNNVSTRFSSLSLTDEFRPSDRLVVNAGLRVETFKFLLGNTNPTDPARQFFFNVYNREHCINPTTGVSPDLPGTVDANGNAICPAGEQTLAALGNGYALYDKSGGSVSATRFEPRLSFTYTLNPDTVLRGSYGVYARPQNSSWVQYNTVQEDLPSFLGQHFYAFGFRSPQHDIRPDTSYNMDASLEKRLHGTDWSFKLTPFYRSTKDQLQNFFIDPLTGLESGLNVGHQISSGVEFAISKGDFNRDGLSGQLSMTYTHSRIKYGNFDNTNNNVIDGLNQFIRQYNSYTAACAGATPDPNICGSYGNSNARATFTNGAVTVANPYYCTTVSASCPYSAQAPLDKNAYYSTYDVIPGPFSAENGYETPFVASLILNWKHKRWTVTPTVAYTSGAKYGAPLSWPGYDPSRCTANLGASTAADPASCSSSATGLPLFIPDVYTGKFDNLGDFKQPWRVQASVSVGYDVSSRITTHLSVVNLLDHCGQRGYAWDQANVCVYGALPSGIFAPAGNFYPNSNGAAPVQMKYPYSFLLNNNNTGFVGTTLPLQATFDIQIKL